MKKQDQAQRHYAKQLTQLSLDSDGRVSPERVSALLETLKQKSPPKLARILKLFAYYLSKEVKRGELKIEYAGSLGNSTTAELQAAFSKKYGCELTVVAQECSDLIAGLRVHVADDVYDSSVKGRLAALAQATV